MIAQCIELVGPKLAVGCEPLVQLFERSRVQAVEPARSVDTDRYQPGIAQGLEVLADIGLGQVESFDERARRLLALAVQGEDVAANGVSQGSEDFHAHHMP
jgi:hypothetical protein